MKFCISLLGTAALIIIAADWNGIVHAASAPPASPMSFFVTSAKSKTGNLGGLAGADRICQSLAAAVGRGDAKWRAYLSAERDADSNNPVHARDRIGSGPWYNANGLMVGKDLADLHERRGNPILFGVDEKGQLIPGGWPGSPRPTEHDVLTGSTPEGRLMEGKTCSDWTSESQELKAQIGHADGIGREGNTAGSSASWNSAHESRGCNDTAPGGGAGRFYCFAVK
jgi:hypothetical protein